ncbi:CinA family protein [Actinomyces gaoshouyii]|uniref:CinA family protein n=1 Tax=Actinomyces gaoshouyii TaxID=1960083 RepID=UPI0009C03BAE|nr:CinA family protein [Actinomyces gaoshouyii]ARD41459.1 competence protein [Actinomyces gaoshouyii]
MGESPASAPAWPEGRRAADDLLRALGERGLTLAVAESLTAGMVSSALGGVPGASTVLVGAVVSYATRIKAELLGVDAARLACAGPVDAVIAQQMARGAARLLGADAGLATTGVAGPGPADGHPAGTVHIAAFGPWGTVGRRLGLTGGRDEIRAATTLAVLRLAARAVREGL